MDRALKDRSQASAVRKNPCLTLVGSKLYEQRHETGDITFVIDSEEIPAHCCVLAALSPKYKAQFYGPISQKDIVNVVDVSPAAFKEFLQFFYLDEVILTMDNIEDILNLAKQSLVDELIAECTKFLLDVIGLDKLVWFYQLAIKYEITPLEEFCVKQIKTKTKSVFRTPGFLSCDQEMLCHILDVDLLNCNEIDVFNGCIAWARTKCENGGVNASHGVNLRAALGDAIFKIRFCSMTVEKLATIGKKYSGLLSAQESVDVFNTITLKANGQISSIFGANNSKPRMFIPSSLECSFSKGSPIMFILPVFGDFLYFSCDKAICLNGFVICNRIDDDVRKVVFRRETYFNVYVSQTLDFTKLTSGNETKIIFYNPIHVEANKEYSISFKLKTSAEYFYGFRIEKNVQQNGASFQFERFCNQKNSITRLLYNSIK